MFFWIEPDRFWKEQRNSLEEIKRIRFLVIVLIFSTLSEAFEKYDSSVLIFHDPNFPFYGKSYFTDEERIEQLSSVIFWTLILTIGHSVRIVYEKRKSFLVHTRSEVNGKDANTSDTAWKVFVFGIFLVRIFLYSDYKNSEYGYSSCKKNYLWQIYGNLNKKIFLHFIAADIL